MGDVKDPKTASPTGETTPEVQPQEPEQTPKEPIVAPVETKPVAPAPAETPAKPVEEPEETVPRRNYENVQKALKQARQRLAEARKSSQPAKAQPEGLDEIRQHPYVQDLEMDKAESQLRRGAEDILKNYPSLPEQVRKAILRNPRGYVGRDTQDVENGLLDIEEYVQGVLEDIEAGGQPSGPQPKQVPVAGTNQPTATTPSATPAEIQKILDKPVDEWTAEEQALMKEHGAPQL